MGLLTSFVLFTFLQQGWNDSLIQKFNEQHSQGTLSAFGQAYNAQYGSVVQEADIICNQGKSIHMVANFTCLSRKPLDLDTFKYKSGTGGLSDADRKFLGDIYFRSESVIEFGVGESTDIAAATNLPRYVGVDSSSEWIVRVRARSPQRFRFFLADIGPVKGYGMPEHSQTAKMMLNYQLAALFMEQDPFDVYLIDGRWRVACAMTSLLHAIHTGGDMNKTLILIHDYKTRKEKYYGVVEKVAKVIGASESGELVAFSIKPHVTETAVYAIYKVSLSIQNNEQTIEKIGVSFCFLTVMNCN
jgi:hypothetical protein